MTADFAGKVMVVIACIFGSLIVIGILPRLVCAFCEWRMAKLWERMTPEQRLAIRCREMAEAIRRNAK